MIGNRLPDIPDPTKVAQAGAEVVKAVGQGAVGVGVDIAEGLRSIAFSTVEGGARTVDQAVKNLVGTIKTDIDVGKSTIDNVRREVDQACNKILSQVDQAVGGEVVRKFKTEIERQLR